MFTTSAFRIFFADSFKAVDEQKKEVSYCLEEGMQCPGA